MPACLPAWPPAEVGIEMKFKDMHYPVLIGATHVPELNAIQVRLSLVTCGLWLAVLYCTVQCMAGSAGLGRAGLGSVVRCGAVAGITVWTSDPASECGKGWQCEHG